MQNKFLKNIIFLLFVNLLVKPFWIFGVDREVQNLLGNASYGLFYAVNNFAYLFYILLDLGLTNFNNRNIAQNNDQLSEHLVSISQVKLFLGIAYAFVIFFIAKLIGYGEEEMHLLFWCGLNWVMLSFILYLRSNVSALLLFKTDSMLSVLDRILSIIICGFLLWSGVLPRSEFSIYWYIYSQTLAYAITLITALIIVLRHSGKLKFKVDIKFALSILKQSLPYALLVLLMSFYNRLEPVLINSLLPKDIASAQTGIYAQAFRILDAGNNISYLFSVILLPLFAACIKKGEDISQLVRQSFSLLITFIGIGAILCVIHSRNIMELLYNMQDYETEAEFAERIGQSSLIFKVLMGSFVSISVTYIFGTLLTANGNLKQLNILAASGVAINVILNFLLIPRLQSEGAAVTSFVTQFATAMAQYFIAKNILGFRFEKSFWARLAMFFVAIIIVSILITYIPIHWVYQFLLALSVDIVLAFVFKTLDLDEALELVKSSKSTINK